jgi:RHS repeat-associated protein
LIAAATFFALGETLFGQAQVPAPNPGENPESNTGALKEQITTAGSYDAHSGNATRIVEDLHLPNALGKYGLDFSRYWNSLHPELDNPYADWPGAFADSRWSHSWRWVVTRGEDTWQKDECGGACGTQYWETSLTIGFPDGHTNKYKVLRADRGFEGQPFECRGRGWDEPYLAQCGERDWPSPGGGVHDRLGDMAQDGSEFWLHLADGGSVHFLNGANGYQATEVFDPNGFRTDLHYRTDGRLDKVTQEGGRWLDIIWDYRANYPLPVIVAVQSGGFAGVQGVTYNYNRYPDPNGGFLVVTSVDYPEGTSAVYTYGSAFIGDDPAVGPQSVEPLLKSASDPRYPGAMTRIRYDYQGETCVQPPAPPNPPPAGYFDWFWPQPYAIRAEKSGETAVPVSLFAGFCASATRRETNGFGAQRDFYFGRSAGDQGTHGYHCLGYQLAKGTDFYVNSPSGVPYEFQNFMNGQPREVWDGRGILTENIVATYQMSGETGDDSGLPSEVHHVGSDGAVRYYDRINSGASEAPDPTRIHNPYHHWLFSQTDERNQPITYVRDSRRRIKDIIYPGAAEHFTYNEFNQVASHTLASGAVISYEYDPTTHRLLRECNPVDGWEARKEYTYDALEHVFTVSDARSRTAGKDFSTRMTYNGRHQVLTVECAGTTGGPNPTVTYGYDPYGNRTSITDELGHTQTDTYDFYRRRTSHTEPLNSYDWKGCEIVASRTWNWFYDRWIDGIGQREAYSHTANEWRIQIEPAFNAAGDRRMTARAHDVNNRLITESTGWIQPYHADPNQMGDWYYGPDGENHYFTYDENGQKKTFTDPQNRLTTYDYDLRNRLQTVTETANTVPRATVTLYDATGNKTLTTFPDTRTQQWLDYDAFGQPGRVIDERGNTTNLSYVWGPMKKLSSVITHRVKDGGGTEDQQTTFSYDYMGKPTDTEFPDHTHETTTYECTDGASYNCDQIHTWRTRKGQKKTIVSDARGRELSHSWDDGVTPAVSRSWDDANRLTSITNIWSSIDFAYDAAGQVIWEGNEIAGSGGRTQTNYYRYPNGSVAHLHYPGGTYLRNDYTSRGQLAATGWDDDDNNWWRKLAAYTYLSDGKVGQIDFGNGMRTGYGYDQRGFIQVVDHYQPGGQDLSWRQYWRDSRDRTTAFQKSYNPGANPMENGRGDRFEYDAEGQLTQGWYNATDPANSGTGNTRYDGFGYDELGNRTQNNYVASRGLTSFVRRDNGLNQYASWTPSIIYHDDNYPGWSPPGNGVTMAEGWVTASYNALNQPVAIWSPAYQGTPNFMWFGYDPLGRCVKRWVGDSGDVYSNPATYLHYDGSNLLQEGSNAWGPARVYAHGNRVDEIVWSYNTATGEQAYHHYDARGHCTLLTDSGGGILEQYEYDAFGQPYFYDASGNSIGAYDAQGRWAGYSLFGNRFLFTGREYLSALKLYDFRARMYQPELGRFMQPDPKHFGAGDYNLYRYCHNDPVNRSDPTGLEDRRQVTSDVWNNQRWLQSGSPLSSNGDAALRAGGAKVAQPTGNYRDKNIDNHLPKHDEIGDSHGGTILDLNLNNATEEGGQLIIHPTLNWYVQEAWKYTNVVTREIEHVDRYLYWIGEGDGGGAVRAFNRNPNMTRMDLRKNLMKEYVQETVWHNSNLHKNNRHDPYINKPRSMSPDEIGKAIENIHPDEEPFLRPL